VTVCVLCVRSVILAVPLISITMRGLLVLMAGATVVLGAAVVEEQVPQVVKEQVQAIQTSPELRRIIRKGRQMTRGRSFLENMSDRIMSFFGYQGEDDYGDYDEGSDYYYPSLENTVGGNAGSSYAFYNPYGSNYHPARDDNFEEDDGDDYGWGDLMIDAAMVAVPMAIVLAAMPTGLFTIPIVGRSMQNNIEGSLRDFELPALRAIEGADLLSYTTRECQERIFCEVSRIGRQKDASLIQKLFFLAANLTPDQYAESYGLKKLFKASQDDKCSMYKCVPLMTPGGVFDTKKYYHKQIKPSKSS